MTCNVKMLLFNKSYHMNNEQLIIERHEHILAIIRDAREEITHSKNNVIETLELAKIDPRFQQGILGTLKEVHTDRKKELLNIYRIFQNRFDLIHLGKEFERLSANRHFGDDAFLKTIFDPQTGSLSALDNQVISLVTELIKRVKHERNRIIEMLTIQPVC